MLVRNHLLCPCSDCVANKRSGTLRIQVQVNQIGSQREVRLEKTVAGERGTTNLPYKYTVEVYKGFSCPYCNRPVEVVIDETHSTRYVHLRQAKQTIPESLQSNKHQLKMHQPSDWGKGLTKLMKAPEPTEFKKNVNEYESKYAKLEQIYLSAIEGFKQSGVWYTDDPDIHSILSSYLLHWGRMGRVLGYKGCNRISEKLVEMKAKLEKLQEAKLSNMDLTKNSEIIEQLYDELLNANWISDKGRTKRVGPTATAKVLHLAIPDLFMIWDSRIRSCYGFQESGREYVRFIVNMQNWNKELSRTIETLHQKYGKSNTKIIDEYNWKNCWG
jgi:hypothetical protein